MKVAAPMSDLRYRFTIDLDLSLPADFVWERVSTMEGVNAELMPWLRMTVPPAVRERSLMEGPVGEPMFSSWLLLGGFVPIDRHTFCLEAIEEGCFQEQSSSWLHAVWRHERRVLGAEAGCRVVDTLGFRPRLPFVGRIVLWIVRRVFEHRHRRLARWAQTRRANVL